jgi:hypothetical protein
VGSIFPEKLIFENKSYRTLKVNSAVGLLFRSSKDLGGGKKRKHLNYEMLSCGVDATRNRSNRLIDEILKIRLFSLAQ